VIAEDIREHPEGSDLAAAAFIHVAGDETLLLAFADEGEIDPQDVGRALETLAGRPGHTGAA